MKYEVWSMEYGVCKTHKTLYDTDSLLIHYIYSMHAKNVYDRKLLAQAQKRYSILSDYFSSSTKMWLVER